ncbi:MAG TPA: FliA/WhiG family RNA polymerase sigma factor [Planctomycetota bacterium]|nr:FliA/WhiG family RNA polymerase sigma factor [Planctomycetota bacterium]
MLRASSSPAAPPRRIPPPLRPLPPIPRSGSGPPRKAKEDPDQKTTDELWRQYKKTGDTELRNRLIEKYYPMVRYISERLLQTLPKSIELDDLCSAGLFGLMDAIDGFDLSRGIKFKTYCTTRIRGAILDELRSQDWVPRLVRVKASRLERAWQELQSRYGREPTTVELAKRLGLDLEQIQSELREACPRAIFSLSDAWDDEEDHPMEKLDVLEDRKSPDTLALLQRRDVMDHLLRTLTEKEQYILRLYYEQNLTMREIGELLSLTESRVCQIHSNVMERLRRRFLNVKSSLFS